MARRCGASSAPWSSAARARRPSSARQLCSLTHVLNYSPTRVPTHLLAYSPYSPTYLLTYSTCSPTHLLAHLLAHEYTTVCGRASSAARGGSASSSPSATRWTTASSCEASSPAHASRTSCRTRLPPLPPARSVKVIADRLNTAKAVAMARVVEGGYGWRCGSAEVKVGDRLHIQRYIDTLYCIKLCALSRVRVSVPPARGAGEEVAHGVVPALDCPAPPGPPQAHRPVHAPSSPPPRTPHPRPRPPPHAYTS